MTTGYDTQPAQPAWPPPPPAEPVAAPPPRRSGWVTTSAVILLIVATLSALIGVLMLVLGLALGPAWTDMLSGQPGMEGIDPATVSGIMTGSLVVVAFLALLWAAGTLAAGVGILGGRGWARILGIVLSIIGLLVTGLLLLSVIGSFGMTPQMLDDPSMGDITAEDLRTGSAISVAFVGAFVIGYLIVLVTLIRSGAFFARRAPVA